MKPSFKNILVVGGAGYVGTTLVGLLLKNNYNVTVFDSLQAGGNGLIAFFSSKQFSFIKGDIRNNKQMQHALKNIDAIIHLAAIVGFPACRRDPELSFDINVNGTRTLVKQIQGKMPIFFASTGSVYGKVTKKICTEKSPLHPLSEYGSQKAKAEEIIKKNKEFVIYRFATAFGVSPHMRLDVLPNNFTYKAVKEKSIIVYEKKFMRSFIHVRDMGRSFLFALENYSKMKGQIYNVGDSTMNFNKEDICLLIKKKIDYYLHFADIGTDLEQRDYCVSYEKLASLGFHTTIAIEEGIDELIKVADVIQAPNIYVDM